LNQSEFQQTGALVGLDPQYADQQVPFCQKRFFLAPTLPAHIFAGTLALFIYKPQALVQVQAQMPAFLAEAHADAEAQAQVQEPQEQVGEVQEQVGEVQVDNVNSANSPVVVS
jgi:hypothetical protein